MTPRLPSLVTYNELDGTEVAAVLENRFQQFLRGVPYFQKHITLPRVKIEFQVKLHVWADQPTPEIVPISDKFDVVIEGSADPTEIITAESADSSAPIPGGHPPDQLRELHGLPVSRPARGPRDVGGHLTLSDQPEPLDGHEVQGMPGLKVSRTGNGMIDGMPTSSNATVAKIDQGPAGLRSGNMNRDSWQFGGKGKS